MQHKNPHKLTDKTKQKFNKKVQLMQRATRDSGACLKAHCKLI